VLGRPASTAVLRDVQAAAEHFCLAYRRLGLPITVLRYFNVYGPRLDRLDVDA